MPPTARNHYVSLGRSGLRVSPLCLGTMAFGVEWGWGSTPEDSMKILDAYISAGGNFIDTANIYTKGHSEKIIGARTMDQLEDNLGALGVPLTAAHIASLDEVSKPQLNFPHEFLERTLSVRQGGTTINGRASGPWPLALKSDAERF